MWFNKDVFERFERLSGRFKDMEVAVAEELQHHRNKFALIEKKVDELKWVERRVKTLDAQVDALMNREEEWKRRLAKIEVNMLRESWEKMNKEVYEVVPTKKIVGHCERLLVVAESEEEAIQLAIKGVHFTFEQLPLHSHIAEWGESEIIATEWLM